MIARKYRLPIREGRSMRGGRTQGRFFILRGAGNSLPYSRFAVAISKKTAKSAVVRNRIRRIAYGAVAAGGYYARPGRDFLLIGLPALAEAGKEDIEKDIQKLISN